MIQKTDIEGLLVQIPGPLFSDDRGSFRETWHRDELEQAIGGKWEHVQENQALSKKGVLRGIHIAPWNKFVYVSSGEVVAVIVDLRPSSPTFKKYQKFILSQENGNRLFIPAGCGNSYYVMSDKLIYEYQVDKYYGTSKEQGIVERGVAWNDPELGIDWPDKNPLLSEKDQHNPTLQAFLDQGFAQEILENSAK